jgi:aerobic-type carbon monoxide dehydrogenase small subunit (CoxS/CutS family)
MLLGVVSCKNNFVVKASEFNAIVFTEEKLLVTLVLRQCGFCTRLNICNFYELLH